MNEAAAVTRIVVNLNGVLRGYYGIAVNFSGLSKVHRFVERHWCKMLKSRNREGKVTWTVFHEIKTCFPLQRSKLRLNYAQFQSLAVL